MGNEKADFVSEYIKRLTEGKNSSEENENLQKETSEEKNEDFSTEALKEMYSRYLYGNGVKRNLSKAFEALKAAAEKGDWEAEILLSQEYLSGDLTKKNFRKGFELLLHVDSFSRGFEADKKLSPTDFDSIKNAKFHLARSYLWGLGTAKDMEKALSYFIDASFYGDIPSQNYLWTFYTSRTFDSRAGNTTGLYELCQKKTGDGNFAALFHLALCAEYGWNCEKNLASSFEKCREAAEAGYALAQFYLGSLYQNRSIITNNQKLAFAWYSKSAAQKFAPAQNALGLCFKNGTGTEKNESRAFECFSDSAKNTNSDGMVNAAHCLLHGEGTEKDVPKAVEFLIKAKDAKNQEAEDILLKMQTRSVCFLNQITDSPEELFDVRIFVEETNKTCLYYMTNSFTLLKKELELNGLRSPRSSDFKSGSQILMNVMKKMKRMNMCFAFENSQKGSIYYWVPESDVLPLVCETKDLNEAEGGNTKIKNVNQNHITIPLDVYNALIASVQNFQSVQSQYQNILSRVVASVNLLQEYYELKPPKVLAEYYGRDEAELTECRIVVGKEDNFYDVLNKFRNKAGLEEVELYSKAGLSKQVYSKIRSGQSVPKIETVISLAITLHLTLTETKLILERAGHAFIPGAAFTKIVTDAINQKIENIDDVNEILARNGLEPIGSKVR